MRVSKPKAPALTQTPNTCHYCAGCPSYGRHQITVAGNLSSEVLFLYPSPTQSDIRRLTPMAGREGKEFGYRYLPLAGLTSYECRYAPLVQCGGGPRGEDKTVSQKQKTWCPGKWLYRHLNDNPPKVIVTMGAAAGKHFIPDLDLERDHGRPWPEPVIYGRWTGVVFPVQDLGAATAMTEAMIDQSADMQALGKWLKHGDAGLDLPIDDYAGCEDYRLLQSAQDFWDYMRTYGYSHAVDALGLDTEYIPAFRGTPQEPYCYSFSIAPGTGAVVTKDIAPHLVRHWQDWLQSQPVTPIHVLHNAVADIGMLARFGIQIPIDRLVDTTQLLYHRCLPIGLKPAAHRLLGCKMEEFWDLALEHSSVVAIEYLIEVRAVKFGVTRPRAQSISTKANTILKAMAKDITVDPWKRWESIDEETRRPAEEAFGYLKPPDVSNFPLPVLTRYAARDADMNLRLYRLLRANRNLEHRVRVIR